MKDKRKKKDRTWAEAARLALEKHPNSPMTAKQILEVIQKEGLKETSGTSPLACLNAMLHSNTRVGDGTFFKIPGKSGLYALKKEESGCPADGTLEIGCESELDGTEMAEASSNGEENEVCLKQVTEEASSNRVQSKLVSSFQQHTKKALKQALRQQQKRRNGVSMMVNKTVPRVVLTPLKVSDEQSDSPSGSESKNGEADSSDKETKQGQKSPPGKQISQHLKRLKKSGLGHLKWTKAEDIDIETPGSILVNTNLRALINKHTFASLPQHFQQYLLLLLPEVDRQMGNDGALRLSNSALNNEFFAYAAQGWKQRLSEGEFTPEMQMRIRQEIEKEKKTEAWKEKFFERFYGEKSGMSKQESLQLTSVPNSSEDESSSPETSLNLPGPSTQPENSIPHRNASLMLETEVVEETVCNMDHVSPNDIVGEEELEDILISEESVIHEEIAEEVETTICECPEESDKDAVEISEEVATHDLQEHREEPGNDVESCIMEDEPAPLSETTTEQTLIPDNQRDVPPVVPADLTECTLPTPSVCSHDSSREVIEQDVPPAEDLNASEDNGTSSAIADSVATEGVGSLDMELISEPEEQLSEAPCVSETSLSSESPEGACISVASPGVDIQSASEEPYTPASVETAFLSEVSSFENAESEGQQKQTAESPPASGVSDVSPLSTSPELSETSPPSNHPLTPEPSPASNIPTSEVSPMSDVPLLSETSSVASESGHITNLPATSNASSVYSSPQNENLMLQQESSPASSEESQSLSKDETDAYSEASQTDTIGTEHDGSENLKYNSATPNSDTSLSEDTQKTVDHEKQSGSSAAELSPPDIITIKNHSSHYRIVDKKYLSPPQEGFDGIHSRTNESTHTKSHEKLYSTSLEASTYYESSRTKSHKQVGSQSRVDGSHSKSYEYNKQSETSSREPEISKRKTAELHTFGNYKEKRPRIDDDHPTRSSSNSSQADREHLPREEPRVPPLKIQLSKIGPPFIIKSQPAPKLESKMSSSSSVSGGRNTGARTLADIKARAQQARAQREAAAAAAVAAAASIVSGGVGSPSESSKTRTLAHIKETTKAKLFAKHQARSTIQPPSREGKSKDSFPAAEASTSPDTKVEGSTGVIIVNPNCKSPSTKPSLHRELTSTLQKSLSSSASSETDSDVSLHGSNENIHVPHSTDKVIKSTSTDDCSVPMHYRKPIGSVSVCPTADASFTNPLEKSAVLMSVDHENTTSTACNLSMINPVKESDIPFMAGAPEHTDETASHTTVSESRDDMLVAEVNGQNYYASVPASSIGNSMPNPHLTNSLVNSLNMSGGFNSRLSDKLSTVTCKEGVYPSVPKMSNHEETLLDPPVPAYPNSNTTPGSDPSLAKMHLDNVNNTCSNLSFLNSKPLPSALTQANRSIPCKVIVDHCTTPNASYAFSSENVENMDSQIRLSKKDVPLQNKGCPQVSVISRQDSISNENTEHISSANAASMLNREDRKKVAPCTSHLETSYKQHDKFSDSIPCQQNINELHRTSSYKCGKDNLSEYLPTNRICWSDKEQINNDCTALNHLSAQKCLEYNEENTLGNRKCEPGSYPHVSKRNTCSPVANSILIKTEVTDSGECFGMETEGFSGHITTPQVSDLGTSLASSKTVGVSRDEPLSLTNENLKRVTNAGVTNAGNTSCRLSSVEANNPLVTQLLQGNLPLEKVLPQPRFGAKLEISRLPLQTTSVYKTFTDKIASENPPCSPTPDKGYPVATLNSLQIRKRENHPKKRVARTLGEHAQIKCESGKLSMDTDANLSSCMMGSHINSLGQEQTFKQEWVNKHAVAARIAHSPEIKQQKRPLPSCSFQQNVFNADKNGSVHPEAISLHRQHYYQMPMSQRVQGPNIYMPSSGSTKAQNSNTAFSFTRHPEQRVLAEANVPSLPTRIGNAYSPNVHIKEGDDLSNAPQTLQHKFLVHPSLSNSEVPPDQKQPAVTMETTKRLSWPQPASICSNIKSEPISFEDGLSNSCELTMKQSSYEQSEVKEQLKAFALKNADFSSYLLSEPQKPFTQIAAQKTQTQQQQQCGSYPAINFGSTSFKRAASAIEKSIGILGNNSKPISGLSSQNTANPAQKFADSSSADELELKCSCRLKAMIVCKGCGAFCHDDCIGPSKLCVACLVVR
ncbi:putative Polycomb group protein ASXL3 [Gastrophryne carolinensis]